MHYVLDIFQFGFFILIQLTVIRFTSEVKQKEQSQSSGSNELKTRAVENIEMKFPTKKGTNRSALHVAVCNGLYADVEKIIVSYQSMGPGGGEKLQQDMNGLDQLGFNPLHAAVTLQDGERMTRLLISAGAFVTATDTFGNTPLHWAARVGYIRVMENLMLENCPLGKFYFRQ